MFFPWQHNFIKSLVFRRYALEIIKSHFLGVSGNRFDLLSYGLEALKCLINVCQSLLHKVTALGVEVLEGRVREGQDQAKVEEGRDLLDVGWGLVDSP